MKQLETLSLKEAAEAVGKTKPTILKKIQKGDIMGVKDEKKEWRVNFASLNQNYKILPEWIENYETGSSSQTSSNETLRNTKGNDNLTGEIMALRVKVEVQDERLKDKDGIIQSLKDDKQELQNQTNKYLETISNQTMLITAQQQPQAKPVENNIVPLEQPKKSYWGRGVAVALVIASLAIGGTVAILSPEKLAFLKTNESQAVAAISTDSQLRAIVPAANNAIEEPKEGAQSFSSTEGEDASKK